MDDLLMADSNKNVEWLNHLEHHTNFYISILKDRSGLGTSRIDKNIESSISNLNILLHFVDKARKQLKAEDKLKPVGF